MAAYDFIKLLKELVKDNVILSPTTKRFETVIHAHQNGRLVFWLRVTNNTEAWKSFDAHDNQIASGRGAETTATFLAELGLLAPPTFE